MSYDRETHARGVDHGWDAANYADAYGVTQTQEEEAAARAAQYAEVDPSFDTSAYTTGFAEGWERFTEGQWQDGSPREQE